MRLFRKRNRPAASHPPGMKLQVNLEQTRVTCPKCKTVHTGPEAWQSLYICPKCGKYMPIGAKERLAMVLDEASFEPWFENVGICDPLNTPGYPEKLDAAQKKSGSSEAVTVGYGKIGGHGTVIGVCDPNFMIGSMGRTMGERTPWPLSRPRSASCL